MAPELLFRQVDVTHLTAEIAQRCKFELAEERDFPFPCLRVKIAGELAETGLFQAALSAQDFQKSACVFFSVHLAYVPSGGCIAGLETV